MTPRLRFRAFGPDRDGPDGDTLAEGGHVAMPLAPGAWAALYGMCTDRFGVQWMVNWAG